MAGIEAFIPAHHLAWKAGLQYYNITTGRIACSMQKTRYPHQCDTNGSNWTLASIGLLLCCPFPLSALRSTSLARSDRPGGSGP